MNAAMKRLGLANRKHGGALPSKGRLIVALDLTSSRAESLRQAQKATTQMFDAIEAVGAGFFVNSTGDPIFADPVSASGTSVTLPHPILSTYTIAGFEIQTVGYVFGYESLASISTTPWNANLTVRAGAVAADVDNDGYSWPTQSSTLYKTLNFNMPNDRRQPTFMARLGGAWFTVTLSNSTDNTMYSFERMFLTFAPGGRNRYQR